MRWPSHSATCLLHPLRCHLHRPMSAVIDCGPRSFAFAVPSRASAASSTAAPSTSAAHPPPPFHAMASILLRLPPHTPSPSVPSHLSSLYLPCIIHHSSVSNFVVAAFYYRPRALCFVVIPPIITRHRRSVVDRALKSACQLPFDTLCLPCRPYQHSTTHHNVPSALRWRRSVRFALRLRPIPARSTTHPHHLPVAILHTRSPCDFFLIPRAVMPCS